MSLSHAAAEPAATDFLALRPGLSIVRKATVSSAYHPLPNRPLARVVGVLSSPEDQDPLDLWRDKAAIEKAVKNVNERTKRKTIELRWVETRATREAVTEALADGADIVHYGGHGVYDPDTDQGYILLETESGDGAGFSAEHLAALLLGSGVRLVVLGACETARRDGRNMWSGVAPALTRERVPAVIANQFDILDDSATLLAETLYPLLLGGHTVDEALSEARRAIYQSGTLEDRDWGSPVLYLHEETGVLFPLQKLDESGAARHSPFVHVALELGNIADEVIGVRARHLAAGKVDVNIKAGDVKKGGRVIGAEFGTISGPGGADATYLDDDDEDDV